MIVKAIKSISVGVLIQLGLGLAVQGLAQAEVYCVNNNTMGCFKRRLEHQQQQIDQMEWDRNYQEILRQVQPD